MALNLKKRNLKKYDIEVHVDMSGSMSENDCHGVSRYEHAAKWVSTLVQEAEQFDTDGPTVGFFDHELTVFENTTFAKVASVFKQMAPRGTTDTAKVIRERCLDYLDKRLGIPATKGTLFSRGKPAIPANPNTKPRIIVVITDGVPDDEPALEQAIVGITKRMTSGGLTKEDLVISFIQVGYNGKAKVFLAILNDGLEAKGATMDIVGCITCEEAMKLPTPKLLEKALDAE